MSALDPRRNAFRPDLAARSLKGRVEAARFVAGVDHQVRAPSAPVRSEPSGRSALSSQALFGEIVRVYDARGDWAWGQLAGDGYVGYLPRAALVRDITAPTHTITAARSLLFREADIKSPDPRPIGLNARLGVEENLGALSRLAGGAGFAVTAHIAPLGETRADFVTTAEAFLGAPYLWGGKQAWGIDCSGLVQVSLAAAGIDAPRDSDMQREELGESLDAGDLSALRRGDLVFWRGHVGIMVSPGDLLHANVHHMAVVIEPLPAALERIGRTAGDILRIARMPAQ